MAVKAKSERARPWWVEPALLLAICAIGLTVRVYDLRTIPPGLYNDEAAYAMDALDVAQGTHYAVFYERNNGREPLFIYIAGMVFRLLGASAYTLRLTAAIIGTLTIAATYWMVRAEARFAARDAPTGSLWARPDFPIWAAAWVSLFLALSYWHISFSRLGFRAITLPLLLAITVAFFFRAWWRLRDEPDFPWSDVLLAGAAAGLSFYTYTAGRFVIVLLGLGVGLSLMVARSIGLDRRRVFYAGLLMLAAALLVAAPMLVYFVQHPESFGARAASISIFSPEFAANGPVAAFVESASKVALLFFTQHDPNLRHDPAQRPLFDFVLGLWLAAGCLLALVRWRRFALLFFLLWAILFAAPSVLTAEGVPHSLRAIGMMPGIFVMPVAAMLWAGGRLFAKRERWALWLPLPFLLLSGITSVQSYFSAFRNPEPFRTAFLTDYVTLGEAISGREDSNKWLLTLSPAFALSDAKLNTVDFYVRDPNRYATVRMDATAPAVLQEMLAGGQAVNVLHLYDVPDLSETAFVFLDAKGMMDFLLRRDAAAVETHDGADMNGIPYTTYTLDAQPDFALPAVTRSISATYGDTVALTGLAAGGDGRADAAPVTVHADQPLWAVLEWEALRPIDIDLKTSLVLLDDAGHIVAQQDGLLTGDHYPALRTWEAGETTRTYHLLEALPGVPPGTYTLALSVYEDESGRVYPNMVEGADAAQRALLGEVELLPPQAAPEIAPQFPLTQTMLGPEVRLAGYDLPRAEVAPGEPLGLTLYWQAAITPTRDLSTVVELVDGAGVVVAGAMGAPGGSGYPTTAWTPGFAVRDRRDLPLAATTPAGAYALRVRLLDGANEVGGVELGEITVGGRPRVLEEPLIEQPLAATFGDSVRLVGVSGLPATGITPDDTLALTFVWQPLRTMDAPLVRSVQVLDAAGALVAQQDAVPCDAQCPAPSWLPDEYLLDTATLDMPADLPPGAYRVIVGWYSPETQQRLPAVDADGAPLADNMAVLPVVAVGP